MRIGKILPVGLILLPLLLRGQMLAEEKSSVIFFSDAPLEDIKAVNTQSRALMDLNSSEVAFEVPIIHFEFEKDLMKQHFNEKYMDTDKYPSAKFGGSFVGFDKSRTGIQHVTASGKLTIHGVTKDVKIPGTIEVLAGNKLAMNSKFIVKLVDYKIKIPQIVWQNIAEEVEVTIEFIMKPK